MILYVFLVFDHGRRKVIHFAITETPSMDWVIQQLREAMPFGLQPKYLFRDNDGIYGNGVKAFLKRCGIEEVRTAYRSPWQKDYASYCTSLVLSVVNLFKSFLSDNFVPCIFTGLSPAMSL